ncbi:hypothetical protein SPHV1_2430083 [Novosphingobium sp. KN65.2]|nr:hypothetical protein SPHV1_2430083 [Novosphingobium sp. KN65.2]
MRAESDNGVINRDTMFANAEDSRNFMLRLRIKRFVVWGGTRKMRPKAHDSLVLFNDRRSTATARYRRAGE